MEILHPSGTHHMQARPRAIVALVTDHDMSIVDIRYGQILIDKRLHLLFDLTEIEIRPVVERQYEARADIGVLIMKNPVIDQTAFRQIFRSMRHTPSWEG